MKNDFDDVKSPYLKEFIDEIQHRNRNPQNNEVLKLLDDFSTNPEKSLTVGTLLYRGRIIKNEDDIGKTSCFWGYNEKDSFVPPPEATRDMRANYRYIPYLYCASSSYVASVEVRPRLGAGVSVATIEIFQELKLLDFTLKEIPNQLTPEKLTLFEDLSYLFSKPITHDDDVFDYIPTQYVAEYVKNLGYDGIAFKSSLLPKLNELASKELYNIVVFNYEKCKAIKSNIIKVIDQYTECEQIDDDKERLYIRSPLEETLSEI